MRPGVPILISRNQGCGVLLAHKQTGQAKIFRCTGTRKYGYLLFPIPTLRQWRQITVYRSFHGATERFDWLIVSQQGDSPIDLLMTSRTDSFPLFARPRKESCRFDPPQKSARFCQKCKIVARFCQKSRLTVRPRPHTRDLCPGK